MHRAEKKFYFITEPKSQLSEDNIVMQSGQKHHFLSLHGTEQVLRILHFVDLFKA